METEIARIESFTFIQNIFRDSEFQKRWSQPLT